MVKFFLTNFDETRLKKIVKNYSDSYFSFGIDCWINPVSKINEKFENNVFGLSGIHNLCGVFFCGEINVKFIYRSRALKSCGS